MELDETTVPAAPAAGAVLITAAEHARHRAELVRLADVRDRELPEKLRRARGFVAADAAEEIVQIQEEQAAIDMRIDRLKGLLASATIVDDAGAAETVTVGCVVDVEYLGSARRATYRVTGAESVAGLGSVSARSPVGQALLGGRAGDVVVAELPGGRVEQLRIARIATAE